MNDDTSMNSPDLDPLHELASAHLDGATSSEERARVHASAELTAIVASFTALRADLADVPPAAAAVRDSGIAAALAHFDELRSAASGGVGASDVPAAAPVVQLASRRRWPAIVMSAAAGLALLGAVGVSVLGSNGSNDESSAVNASKDREMSASGDAATETMAANELTPVSTIDSIFSAGEVATVIETPEQLVQLPVPADVAFDEVIAGGSASDTGVPQVAAESARRAALSCLSDTQVFLADILYMGELAVAARDTVSGVTVAITDDCRVLVAVGP